MIDIKNEINTIKAAQRGENVRDSIIESFRKLSSGIVLGEKKISKGGTYNASEDNVDGYSSVIVNVSDTAPSKLIEKTITTNGVYMATADKADGFSKVIVDVAASSESDDVEYIQESNDDETKKILSKGFVAEYGGGFTINTSSSTFDYSNSNHLFIIPANSMFAVFKFQKAVGNRARIGLFSEEQFNEIKTTERGEKQTTIKCSTTASMTPSSESLADNTFGYSNVLNRNALYAIVYTGYNLSEPSVVRTLIVKR